MPRKGQVLHAIFTSFLSLPPYYSLLPSSIIRSNNYIKRSGGIEEKSRATSSDITSVWKKDACRYSILKNNREEIDAASSKEVRRRRVVGEKFIGLMSR